MEVMAVNLCKYNRDRRMINIFRGKQNQKNDLENVITEKKKTLIADLAEHAEGMKMVMTLSFFCNSKIQETGQIQSKLETVCFISVLQGLFTSATIRFDSVVASDK